MSDDSQDGKQVNIFFFVKNDFLLWAESHCRSN